jgi:hypothetical protein
VVVRDTAAPACQHGLDDQLFHLYSCQQLSTYQVAQITGIDRQQVTRKLHAAGVPVKPRGSGRRRKVDPREALAEDLYVRCGLTSTAISEFTGVPARTIRGWLHARNVPMRTPGRLNREDRQAASAGKLIELYVRGGLSATETGHLLGLSRGVVLRTAHGLGLPVRLGGPPPRHGPAEIELIEALYADPGVRQVLRRYGIAGAPPGGAIWERFPARLAFTPELGSDLYVECGLGMRHIELLTGIPAQTVRALLHHYGIPLRGPGGRSPFLRRWRTCPGQKGVG